MNNEMYMSYIKKTYTLEDLNNILEDLKNTVNNITEHITKNIIENINNYKIDNLENIINYLENITKDLKNNNIINKIKKNDISIIDYIKYLHLKEVYNNEELKIIKYNLKKKERLNKIK